MNIITFMNCANSFLLCYRINDQSGGLGYQDTFQNFMNKLMRFRNILLKLY